MALDLSDFENKAREAIKTFGNPERTPRKSKRNPASPTKASVPG